MNPARVENHERLGHGVFDSDHAERQPPRPRFFVDEITYAVQELGGRMSVDRLTYADLYVLTEVHDNAAMNRGANRRFYGWFTIGADLLRDIGLSVVPSGSVDQRNRWHADVIFTDLSTEVNDQITEYANAITSEALWQAKPLPLSRRVRDDIEGARDVLL
jgi:hypothetical protein